MGVAGGEFEVYAGLESQFCEPLEEVGAVFADAF